MRDAYAMHLHSVPSRFSHKVHQTPTQKNVFGALFFYIRIGGYYNKSGKLPHRQYLTYLKVYLPKSSKQPEIHTFPFLTFCRVIKL